MEAVKEYMTVIIFQDGSIGADYMLTKKEAMKIYNRAENQKGEAAIYHWFGFTAKIEAKTENFPEIPDIVIAIAMDCHDYYKMQNRQLTFDDVSLVRYEEEGGWLADYKLMFNNDTCLWSGDEGNLREAKAIVGALIAMKKNGAKSLKKY